MQLIIKDFTMQKQQQIIIKCEMKNTLITTQTVYKRLVINQQVYAFHYMKINHEIVIEKSSCIRSSFASQFKTEFFTNVYWWLKNCLQFSLYMAKNDPPSSPGG